VQVVRKDTNNNVIGAANNSLLPNLNDEEDEVNTSDVWKAFQSGNTFQAFEPQDEALAAGTICVLSVVRACPLPPIHASVTLLARAVASHSVCTLWQPYSPQRSNTALPKAMQSVRGCN
jgi:hypothetical protein